MRAKKHIPANRLEAVTVPMTVYASDDDVIGHEWKVSLAYEKVNYETGEYSGLREIVLVGRGKSDEGLGYIMRDFGPKLSRIIQGRDPGIRDPETGEDRKIIDMSPAATIEINEVQTEPVRVRILPDGRMDRENAAKYLGRKPKTLAMWALEKRGPDVHKAGGRCFYYRNELNAFIRGESERK